MNEPRVVSGAKSATFQMRMNPEVKARVEEIYADCGMTLTDAINTFLQQSINVGGLPFLVSRNNKELLRQKAIDLLMDELRAGDASIQSDADWVSEADMATEFGVEL